MPKRRTRRWLTVLVAVTLLFLTIGIILSRVVASNGAKRYLTARLEQAFGRPVDVSSFGIRWFPTPGIAAQRVTIGEDPRFGQEYFLRADSIVASPRWRSLFLGKLQLGTLEFSQPSLNLVRDADGRWNVESWLPSPAAKQSATGVAVQKSPRVGAQLSRIEIDGGRINFSRGVDRRPFALTDLQGSIEQESPGRWRISLEAHPLRATVHLQDSGTLRVAGVIAGTSARLHPANLAFTWSDASLADALRLALGKDPGVRGEFGLQISAHTEEEPPGSAPGPAQWNVSFNARVANLHRWDMAARQDNPAVSVHAEAGWRADVPQITLRKVSVEGPHSSVAGTGTVSWANGIDPELQVTSPGIAFDDLFAWYRSFQPGLADGLAADGFLSGNTELSGWPIRVRAGKAQSDGATIKLNGAKVAKSSLIQARFAPGEIEILPMAWTLADSTAASEPATAKLEVDRASAETVGFHAKLSRGVATLKKPAPVNWNYDLELKGEFAHFENLLNAARLLGRPLNAGWEAEGGLSADLRWQGTLHEKFARATGEVIPHGMLVKLPLLNQPVEIGSARIELKPGEQRVTITNAAALGAHWQGTIWRGDTSLPPSKLSAANGSVSENVIAAAIAAGGAIPEWEFDLSADSLDAAELDRWMGPRARPNWLARLFNSEKDASSEIRGPGPLSQLHARGILRADTFALAPLEVKKVRAQVELLGRNVNLSEFDAQIDGGFISGGLLANLEADPTYWLHAAVKDVNVANLAMSNADLRDRVTGQLSGEVRLSLHGVGREKLLDSLKGEGRISATQVGIRGLNLSGNSEGAAPPDSPGQFALVNGEMLLDARKIRFRRIELIDRDATFEGTGTSDFSRTVQFELWPRVQPLVGTKRGGLIPAHRVIRVSGLLEAPHVSLEPLPAGGAQTEPASVRH